MPDRLTALEQAALALDTARTPAAVGTVVTFEDGSSGIDRERLLALVRDRIRYVPRYRQRVLDVPGRLADPVWVDDADFDPGFHVRHAVLPRPGGRQQLWDFAGRVLSRPLDRARPLWELYLVEGLEHDHRALLAKTHQCLVDGVDTVDLLQVLLDNEPDDSVGPEDGWHPIPAPGPLELITGAVTESLRDPARTVTNLQHAATDAVGAVVAAGEALGRGAPLGDLAAESVHGGSSRNRTPLVGSVSDGRRVHTASADLDDLRRIAAELDHPVHDVLLGMITGGLRRWLMTRGENVTGEMSLSALTPVSVIGEDDRSSLGSTVEPRLATMPIGEPDAATRMAHIASETQAHKDSERSVPARELSEIAGFAPATLHDLGVRGAGDLARRPYDVLISNAPGPQSPVYLGTTPITAGYPVVPLSPGHRLALGITSYNGSVLIGLNADRDAFDDLDVLAQCILDELDDLTAAVGGAQDQPDGTAGAVSRRRRARRDAKRFRTSTRRGTAGSALQRKAAAARAERSNRRRADGTPTQRGSMREDQPDGSAQDGDH